MRDVTPRRNGAPATRVRGIMLLATGSALACASGRANDGPAGPTGAADTGSTHVAPTQRATTLAAGGSHSCQLTAAGAAYCWGNGSNGQLGDGSAATQRMPVAVAGGVAFASVTAGEFSSCALSSAGAAYCWGGIARDPSSDGAAMPIQDTPSLVNSEAPFTSIASGYYHACALTAAGVAYCWGLGVNGQLGDGTLADYRGAAVRVSSDLRFASLTGGYWHTCGVTLQGTAYCWGNNNWGQLGDSTRIAHITAAPVGDAAGANIAFAMLAAGGRHSCGLSTAGTTYCWGWNAFGQVGDGSTTTRLMPVSVVAPSGVTFVSIVAGWYHNCGLTAAGAAYCWGFNDYGRLGDGTLTNRAAPAAVAGGLVFSSLSAGVDHTCGMTTSGVVYCWGSNSDGQLGNGTTVDATIPVLTSGVLSPARARRGTLRDPRSD